MILKVINNLLLAWMHLWRYILPHNIKFNAMTRTLPLEMKVWITIRRLQPKVLTARHRILY